MDLTDEDIRALHADGDLVKLLKQEIAKAPGRNKARKALVDRYPDLAERIYTLPGHKQWSGSVGGRKDVAAIVQEAEQRAAREDRRAAA